MTTLLWKFCHHGNPEARDEARLAILARGEAIVPELIQAVEEELQNARVVHLEECLSKNHFGMSPRRWRSGVRPTIFVHLSRHCASFAKHDGQIVKY